MVYANHGAFLLRKGFFPLKTVKRRRFELQNSYSLQNSLRILALNFVNSCPHCPKKKLVGKNVAITLAKLMRFILHFLKLVE